MGPAWKSLVLVLACVSTILLLLFASGPPGARPDKTPFPAPVLGSPAGPGPAARAEARKYYFDVIGHSPDEFQALLERARMIYDQTPPNDRASLEVVLVLHGPDIAFFAAPNYEKYQSIVDLSAKLDAFGVFDFKMCAASAARLGLASDDVPAFVEFVPYGPTEIQRLEEAGFVQL